MAASPPDALLARFGDRGPEFKVCDPSLVKFWQQRGWILLVTEREIRQADLPQARDEDENRFRGDA